MDDRVRRAKEEAAAKIRRVRARRRAPYVDMPEPTGDAEVDSFADLDAVQAGFRRRAKDESARFNEVTDSEYWFAVCFKTRAQREAFLAAIKQSPDGKYLDGEAIARALGIELPEADVKFHDVSRVDKTWIEFAR